MRPQDEAVSGSTMHCTQRALQASIQVEEVRDLDLQGRLVQKGQHQRPLQLQEPDRCMIAVTSCPSPSPTT